MTLQYGCDDDDADYDDGDDDDGGDDDRDDDDADYVDGHKEDDKGPSGSARADVYDRYFDW